MKILTKQKMKVLMPVYALFMAAALAGCGKAADNEKEQPPISDAGEEGGAEELSAKEDGDDEIVADSSGEELSDLQYIELTKVEDYYGDKSEYDVYAPKGNSNEDGFIFYSEHGLTFSASAIDLGSAMYVQDYLEESVGYATEDWQKEGSEYTDVEIGEVVENGKDKYQIITAKKEDVFGTPFEVKLIYYMDVQGKGSGVLWDLELFEINADSETDLIIDELAKCYQVDLDALKASGEWLAANEERINEQEAEDSIPETILWFNATYAPLTYSNSGDWEVVGGMDATEYNKDFLQTVLKRDWDIEDKVSALETVERLKENGHREKCRKCMEELEEMGILDADEETFMQGLADSGIEENLFRYVIAYSLHRGGKDADYIAAWDLCRVNQLYADFYICGYMEYGDAMDASLENSLILQKMYSSWDEMVNAYMLGYQFWQSDPALTEYSPTMQRYKCYEALLEMEDGPYTLDWKMKLDKSW